MCAADASDANAYVHDSSCTGLSSGDFSQKRTHTLSNGEVIWDIAGNAFEWVSTYNDLDKAHPRGSGWAEMTNVTGVSTMPKTDVIQQVAIDNSWDSTEGIGQFYSNHPGNGGTIRRGATYFQGTQSGIFAWIQNAGTSVTNDYSGFRCAIERP